MSASIFLVLLVSISCTLTNGYEVVEPSDCEYDGYEDVKCVHTGDDNVTLDRMLENGTIKLRYVSSSFPSSVRVRVNVDEIAPFVKRLSLYYRTYANSQRERTVSIRPGTLAAWTNLTTFMVWTIWPAIVDVHPHEFVGINRLDQVELYGVRLSENTLKAIEAVSDRLQNFTSVDSHPETEIVSLVAKMSNLKWVKLRFKLFPSSTLRNSASTLKTFYLQGGRYTTIKREMFRGMGNLTLLSISENRNIRSIEEGAFDDLINVQEIHLFLYPIRRLPHGLFNKMKKLKNFLCHHGRFENLSRTNFTHVEDFENFHLRVY